MGSQWRKPNKTKSWLFENINKIKIRVHKLRKKRGKKEIISIRNKKGENKTVKAFDKIHDGEQQIEGKFLFLRKTIYKKSVVNMILMVRNQMLSW